MTTIRDRDTDPGEFEERAAFETTVPDAVPRRQRGSWLVRPFTEFAESLRGFRELRHTPYGMAPAIIFSFVIFFSEIDGRVFLVAAPDIARDAGINVASVIDIAIAVSTVGILAALFVGWWADRHRRVPLYAAGVVVNGLAASASSLASSTVSFGAPRVVAGLGAQAAGVPAYSLLSDYYPPEVRGRTFAFIGSLSRIGRLTSILLVGLFLSAWGWETTLLVLGIPLVIMGIIAGVRLREPVRGYFERKAAGATDDVARVEDEPQSFGEGWRSTFAVKTLRRFFVADIIAGMGLEVSTLLFPFFLAEKYGLSALERGYVLIPSILIGIYGGVIGGGLVDRFSARNPGRVLAVYGIFDFVAAIGWFGYSLKPPLAFLVVFTCVNAFGGALVGPAAQAVYSQVIPPSIRTQGLQVTRLAELPGAIIGLQLGRIVFGNYGYQALFLFTAPWLILSGIVAITAGSFFEGDRRNAMAQAIAAEEWRRSKEAGNKKLIVCRNVDVEYDGVQVLFDVDLDIDEGEIVALLGTNGAGKSTLLRAISGSQEASGGGIVFDGRDITHMPPHEIAGRGVVHMPGGRGVFPALTVRENLVLGNWLTEDDSEVRAQIEEALEVFPVLRERLDTLAGSLSGGEQQQLSLAQAFMMKPKLLMIDELTLGLSPAVVAELLEVVRNIHKRGVTIVIVEQSVNVALNIAERAVFMEKGEVRFVGRTRDLLSRPDILRAVYVKGTGALTEGAPAGARRSERDQRALELEESFSVLEVENVTKRYGGITALDEVSLELRQGEVLGIIGPNGSGKTTLFDVISGFQPADGGAVRLGGVDITALSPDARMRAGLVRRFQDAKLFPSLTVFETLLIALEERLEVKSTVLNAFSIPQARRAERRLRLRAERLIELLSLDAYRDKFVKELSTGLRRIVDLACVLATEPKVLLLDEPSSGVAQAEAEALAPLLRRVRFETGCSILLIEHDMPLVSRVADELIAMDQGVVLLRGTPDAVLNDDRVIVSYLGGSEAAIRRTGGLS